MKKPKNTWPPLDVAGPCNFTDSDRSLRDQLMLGCLDDECAAELDRNVTSTWKVAEVLAVMERHEHAHQARASRRNLETVVHATNYYPSGNAYRQTAPARQSDGVPFDYARFRPPPQRQAVMCS